jgi:hypothetical protein
MTLHRALALVGALTTACTTAIDVHTAESPDARFDQYRTFTFETATREPVSFSSSALTAEVETRAEQLATDVLLGKGYEPASGAAADLSIRIATGQREREIRRPSRSHPALFIQDEEDDFVEGALVVDAFDVSTGELVWHGSAGTVIDPGRVDDARLRRAVSDVLTDFPPR